MTVHPNAIDLIPPRREIIISDRHRLLTDKDTGSELTLPITNFRSSEQNQNERSIGIFLSGTGSDGSRAFRDIHEANHPWILHRIPTTEEVRFRIADCATGEEAFSMTILLHEQLSTVGRPLNVRIFATDAHQRSLDHASAGVSAESTLTLSVSNA